MRLGSKPEGVMDEIGETMQMMGGKDEDLWRGAAKEGVNSITVVRLASMLIEGMHIDTKIKCCACM